ncbi:MAG: hypothetical protein HXS54_09690 [Theionarchaea archaeon]|nr:hypothetical protein [Theionarchaea archaeon]
MSQRFPKNVTKYVVVSTIARFFGEKVISPQSGGFIIHERLTLDYFMGDRVMAVSYVTGFLLLYCGGMLADKYGRRLIWAASLFLFGGGMLWLAFATTYEMALLAAVLLGISSAFGCSSLAWLFDHEGKEGLKTAYGLIHIISVLLLVIGMGITMMGEFHRITFIVTSSAAFAAGGWVITFAENYGNRSSSLVVIAKTGVRQFVSRRVLLLIVLYSLFMRPASWVSGFTLFTYIEKFEVFSPDKVSLMDKTFDTISVVTLFLAGLFLLFLRRTDYRKLIIYPVVFLGGFYVLLPFAPTESLFFILKGGASLFSLITWAGIIILINDSISENRATTLSLMILLMSIPALLEFFLYILITEFEWVTLSLISGALGIVAVLLLVWAVRIHERL